MDNLQTLFSTKSNETLIAIIESGEDYTQMAKDVAMQLIENRKLLPQSVKTIATQIWQDKISKSLRFYLKQAEPTESNFLSPDELKGLFKAAFETYTERQELLSIDTTKYWFV